MIPKPPSIWIITGRRDVGKTRFCNHLVEKARHNKLDVAGVLSPPFFSGTTKTTIEVENLRTGERRQLATLTTDEPGAISTPRWSFDDEVLNWGNKVLASAVPCELLVVDELGLLEFERGQGWLNGMTALRSGQFQSAVVVIRPELVSRAQSIFKYAQVLEIPPVLNPIEESDFIDKILSKPISFKPI
jgi:nucleoside-triphosphatase THEP1